MAKFRVFVVKAFVVMAFGCEDCDMAALIQSKMQSTQSAFPPISRDCPALVKDDCSFKIEPGKKLQCSLEHASRLVHAMWVHPGAKVLEIGARYGQTTCQLSTLLGLTGADGTNNETGAKLVSVDADPDVWDILEANLAEHKCNAEVVRGTIGSKSYKLITARSASEEEATHIGYGNFIVDVGDPRPGTIVPAHSVKSLNVNFDTLALDCVRCSNVFWENPDLLKSLTVIIACTSAWRGESENQIMEKLRASGWEVKHRIQDQVVLCKGPCVSYCDLAWVEEHGHNYWGTS